MRGDRRCNLLRLRQLIFWIIARTAVFGLGQYSESPSPEGRGVWGEGYVLYWQEKCCTPASPL